jgi:formate/nitrite transporter FocA (FNT family)
MADAAHEHQTVLNRKELSARQVHAALRLEGEEELDRSSAALFWSAVAGGATLGLSLLARGLLQHHSPDVEWRPLVASLGYAVGFIAVELGRQELYTGNTLTAALPCLHERRLRMLPNLARVWIVVLVGNLIGAALFAWAAAWTTAFDAPLRGTLDDMARHAVSHPGATLLAKAVFGGWLIALMIWLMPGAHHARVWVIALIAWVLAASQLTHVVTGSVEVLFGVFSGHIDVATYAGRYLPPVLIGNTIGGLVFVALLNHVQVAADERDDPAEPPPVVLRP